MKTGAWVFVGLALLGVLGVVLTNKKPRGLRNNNPLNIEKGADWVGLSELQTDSRFARFVDHRYGYRAAARVLSSYAARGVVHLDRIIETWAPATENHTDSYIGTVCRLNDWERNKVIGPDDYAKLFAAMTVVENGENPYPLAEISEGVSWA